MPNLQTITLIEDLFKEDSNVESGSKYFNPIFDDHGDLADRAEDNLKNRAIRQVLSSGQYKKYWLPVDKELNLPKSKDLKPESKFRDFFQQAWFDLKDKVALSISVLQKLPENDQDNPHRVTLHAVAVFNAQDILNTVELYYSDYLSDAPKPPLVVDEPAELESSAEDSNEPTHEVDLFNQFHWLAFRGEPCPAPLDGVDVYTGAKESTLEKKYPVGAGSLGPLVGLLPPGTKVRVELPGYADGYPGVWDLVKIIEGPPPTLPGGSSNINPDLIGKTAFVDTVGLKKLPTKPTVKDILEAAGNPETITAEVQANIDLVKEYINPAPTDISTDEVNPYVAATNVGPAQDWTRRTPFDIFKNRAQGRYEIVVESDFFPELSYESEGAEDPDAYKHSKRIEARREGLKSLLRYFNRISDDAYISKLISQGQGEISQIEGYWADGNPNNRKIYYLVVIPSAGAGSFNYKSHEPAETLTIKEMIVERVISFQYVFMTNKIEKQVSEIINILKNTIKPGLDSYSGLIKNKPDINLEIKKLESLVPAIKEILSENNIKFRPDKEDQIEMGLDMDLDIVYVRYGPQDGKDGNWKIISPWPGGN